MFNTVLTYMARIYSPRTPYNYIYLYIPLLHLFIVVDEDSMNVFCRLCLDIWIMHLNKDATNNRWLTKQVRR